MKGAPWFKFHVADFLGGTAEMTTAETGAYIRLLCHQWNAGSIPDDLERLTVMAGGPVSALVKSKFEAGNDGRLRNVRLESHREEAGARSQAGERANLIRWRSDRNPTGSKADIPSESDRISPRSPTGVRPDIQSIENREQREENIIKQPFLSGKPDDTHTAEKKKTRREEFESAWKTYPNKSGSKEKAFRAFAKFSDPLADVLAGISRYVQHVADRRSSDFPDLQYQNGQTFFNGRGWTSEWTTNAHKTAAKEAKQTAKAPTVWSLTEQVKQLVMERDGMHTQAMQTENGQHVYPAKLAKFKELCDKIAALRKQIGAVEQ